MQPSHGLSSFALKIVAILGMTCNHIAYVFAGHLPFSAECICFAVGGVTFPIMAFLLVEGYFHTSNIRRYALRLGIFAIIAQIPYALFLGFNGNVLFTLLIGLGLMYFDDHAPNRIVYWITVIAGTLASLACDWGFLGVVMILLYKIFRNSSSRVRERGLPVLVAIVSVGLPALDNVVAIGWAALPSLLYPVVGCSSAIPLLLLYNGQRGKPFKWLFYAYYPAHIAVLGLAAFLMFGA